MPGQRATLPRRRRRRGVLAVAFALAVAAAGSAAPAVASCQTLFCARQRALQGADHETDLRRRLALNPRDSDAWASLLRLVDAQPSRDAFLARWAALYEWAPQPALETDLEGSRDALRQEILDAWKAAVPDDGQPWCREAEREPDRAARLALLRRGADALPDDPWLAGCLADELVAAGDTEAALAHLRALTERQPASMAAWEPLISRLGRAARKDELQAALEERARHLPQEERARRELLAFYDRNGMRDETARLLAELAATGDPRTRWSACSALRHGSAQHRECHLALLAELAAAELAADERDLLDASRDSLFMAAIHAEDWPTLQEILAATPPETLPTLWARIADWLDAPGCAAMVAAWQRGDFAAALSGEDARGQATRLAWALRGCGDPAAAERVLAPFVAGASEDELRAMGAGEATRGEVARRTQSPAAAVSTLKLADDARVGRPLAERFDTLLAWLGAAPADPEPARRLAAASAEAGQGGAAVGWLREAADRKPDDLDLRLAVGTLGLRFREHAEVTAAARRVLASPGNPRQHAEARYLLGRVALREGRREEAASELLAYFPLRLRHAGCCGVAACDRGLQLLLLGSYDLQRLRAYRTERQLAVDWFAAHMREQDGERPTAFPCLRDPLPLAPEPAAVAECVPAGTRELLATPGAGGVAASELGRRRGQAATAPDCPAPLRATPEDLEPLFADAELFALAGELTAVD